MAPALLKSKPSSRKKLAGMKLIRGRDFLMGSDRHYPEEAPVRRVSDFSNFSR